MNLARLANRKKYQKKRETFLQLYNRTCDRVFDCAYALCLNHADALTVSREAYIDMYFAIGTLRTAPNVEHWQRRQVERTMRFLVRKNRLSLIHEKTLQDPPDHLTADEKEDLWRRINRTVDIDPWRLVPVPGKSSLLSVLADQAVSDLSYMEPMDIAKMVLTTLLIVGVIGGGAFGSYYLFSHRSGVRIDEMEEIFLDERSYSAYNEAIGVRVTDEEINALIKDAFGGLDDEGGLTKGSPAARSTAGEPVYTGNEAIDNKLKAILAETITDDMDDTTRLWAIYYYVGKHMRYDRVRDKNDESLTLLKHYFVVESGDSRHYAALFEALCHAAGYECETVRGRFLLNADTEFRRDILHYWNRMPLNGMYYYFDCEADSDAFGTQVRDYYFMATDGNAKWSVWNRDHAGSPGQSS